MCRDSVPLHSQEHGSGIFDGGFDLPEEGDGLASIHETMIVSQSEIHHGTNHHLKEIKKRKKISVGLIRKSMVAVSIDFSKADSS